MLTFEQAHEANDKELASVFRDIESLHDVHTRLMTQLETLGGGEIEIPSLLDRLLYHAILAAADQSLRSLATALKHPDLREAIARFAEED